MWGRGDPSPLLELSDPDHKILPVLSCPTAGPVPWGKEHPRGRVPAPFILLPQARTARWTAARGAASPACAATGAPAPTAPTGASAASARRAASRRPSARCPCAPSLPAPSSCSGACANASTSPSPSRECSPPSSGPCVPPLVPVRGHWGFSALAPCTPRAPVLSPCPGSARWSPAGSCSTTGA